MNRTKKIKKLLSPHAGFLLAISVILGCYYCSIGFVFLESIDKISNLNE